MILIEPASRLARILVLSAVFYYATLPSASIADERTTLALLVRTIAQVEDDAVRVSLMTGMLQGLEGRRNVGAPDGWSPLAEQMSQSDNGQIRDKANRLSQIFGDRAATERALTTLMDSGATIPQRRAALGSLVSQQYVEMANDLEAMLEIDELRIDVIRAYGVIATPDAPKILLTRYPGESREIQRAIVETLATRKSYAGELIKGIQNNVVARADVPAYVARSLRDIMGKEFSKVYGEIPELKQDTRETIEKYKRLLTAESIDQADASRGRSVFQKTCGACHLMYGSGGKVGPDLTGSNRANLDYFLLNSVDPSGDVPEGYRTHLVQTFDGRLITGVLAEEDNQRVVLKTVDQPRVVISKEDIEARKVSEKSMMPDGQLDQMSHRDLFDLVKYMQTKTQVEAAQ
ncbi:MAG: c-type cytochrome [Planctomycetales bacterium]|nr:c-type cytochrome [Planctomycetales bacterium]